MHKTSNVLLISTVAGSVLGYLILSPLSMLISDMVHSHLGPDYLCHIFESPVTSLLEPFGGHFKFWAMAHSVVGGLLGFLLGFVLLKICQAAEKLQDSSKKRVDALKKFGKETHEWQHDVAELQREVNQLLISQGKPPKYDPE